MINVSNLIFLGIKYVTSMVLVSLHFLSFDYTVCVGGAASIITFSIVAKNNNNHQYHCYILHFVWSSLMTKTEQLIQINRLISINF